MSPTVNVGVAGTQRPSGLEEIAQLLTDRINFSFGELAMERQRDRSVTECFADGEIAAFVAELLHVEGLEVNGWEVVAAADTFVSQGLNDVVALLTCVVVVQSDDHDKPTDSAIDGYFLHGDARLVAKSCLVPFGHAVTLAEDVVDAFHLYDPNGAVDVAESTVVAESGMS